MVSIDKLQIKDNLETVNVGGILLLGEEDLSVWVKKELHPTLPFV